MTQTNKWHDLGVQLGIEDIMMNAIKEYIFLYRRYKFLGNQDTLL